MADPLKQIANLVESARQHAREIAGLELAWEQVIAIDHLLDAARDQLERESGEMLASCYGAWFGQQCVVEMGATWLGLAEPVAPRVCVDGLVFSPIDVVRRRLTSAASPTLTSVAKSLQRWSREHEPPGGEYLELNRAAWDARADDPAFAGCEFLPTTTQQALTAVDPWLVAEGLADRRLLCLAAGGGRHGPLHAIAGAQVTVVDLSEVLLAIDRSAAEQRQLNLQTVTASIDDLGPLVDQSFDLVLQPVSSCYVPDLTRMYGEVARVLKPGGLYVVQHKQPSTLQAAPLPRQQAYVWESPMVEGLRLPMVAAETAASHREAGTVEYLHGLESLLGELCRAGFVIEDFQEPPRGDAFAPVGTAAHRAWFMPTYFKIKARRVE